MKETEQLPLGNGTGNLGKEITFRCIPFYFIRMFYVNVLHFLLVAFFFFKSQIQQKVGLWPRILTVETAIKRTSLSQ